MKTTTKKLTEVSKDQLVQFSVPLDQSMELSKQSSKDRKLHKFYQFYVKRDIYDRYKYQALILLILSYLFSLTSCYFSFPFLDNVLNSDIQNDSFRLVGVCLFLLLLEGFKHSFLNYSFKSFFTYSKLPYLGLLGIIVFSSTSIYFCVSGIDTSSKSEYQLPNVEEVTTQYDIQIVELTEANKDIFRKSQYKGKLNQASKAAKAYNQNSVLISDLSSKASKEREEKYTSLVSEYENTHNTKFSVRLYVGYVVELLILLCGGFWLWFMWFSVNEHTLRLGKLYDYGGGSGGTSYGSGSVKGGYNSFSTKNNTISLDQAKSRYKAHRSKLQGKKGNADTNKARCNFYQHLVNEMTLQNVSEIVLPNFVKSEWLKIKSV